VAKDVTNTSYTKSEIFTIVLYLLGLLVIAILLWKFINPIIALVVTGFVAYVADFRKFIGKK